LSNLNDILTNFKRRSEAFTLTPSRRIERVAPVGARVVAMTFDNGPTKLVSEPNVTGGTGLTEHLLAELKQFGAHGTFNVIGSTAKNYPDTSGDVGTPYIFGRKYDHYAGFGLDDMAGAEACPELLRRIDREGHELANHTYRHIIYGKPRTMYGSRVTLNGLDDAVSDLRQLHDLVYKLTKFEMRFARPPHGVDTLPDGRTAFDACEALGYHYLAASLDCGSLPSSGDYDADVDALIRPLRDALEDDPTSLAGRIISQSDCQNASKQTPIASALRPCLELLERYGYRVVTVGELLHNSPFEDVRPADDCFEAARDLDRAGFTLGFRNNRFYPNREVTKRELATIFTLPGGARPQTVTLDRRDAAPVRLISAAASEAFETVSGQPRSNSRGDTAIWLRGLAALNNIC
jgi:peptidoglycan/xylan/chitin deacetylase (PgdA/CDA1 family)